MTDRELMQQALEALVKCKATLAEELAAWDIDPPLHHVLDASNACGPAITALRERLRTPEMQIIDEMAEVPLDKLRKPLTDREIDALWDDAPTIPQQLKRREIARTIEAAHGIKEEA